MKKTVVEVEIPDWLPIDAWNGYLEMRKVQKKPPTNYAVTLLLKKLNAFRQSGHELIAVLEQSIINNWIDVYPPKDQSRHMPAQFSGSTLGPAGRATAQAAQQWMEATDAER